MDIGLVPNIAMSYVATQPGNSGLLTLALSVDRPSACAFAPFRAHLDTLVNRYQSGISIHFIRGFNALDYADFFVWKTRHWPLILNSL
jgi:hypothetical protein